MNLTVTSIYFCDSPVFVYLNDSSVLFVYLNDSYLASICLNNSSGSSVLLSESYGTPVYFVICLLFFFSVSDMYVANPVDSLGERIPVQIDITVAMDCQCKSILVFFA